MKKGYSPEPAGWLLETHGDVRPRGMIAIAREATPARPQNSAYARRRPGASRPQNLGAFAFLVRSWT